jgi:hypothetical protein
MSFVVYETMITLLLAIVQDLKAIAEKIAIDTWVKIFLLIGIPVFKWLYQLFREFKRKKKNSRSETSGTTGKTPEAGP